MVISRDSYRISMINFYRTPCKANIKFFYNNINFAVYIIAIIIHSLKISFMIYTFICNSINDIDNALNASWSGDNIIASYNGKLYRLFEDTPELPTNAHLNLMADSNTLQYFGF